MAEWTKERHDRLRANVDGAMLSGGALEVAEYDTADMLAEIERAWTEIERLSESLDKAQYDLERANAMLDAREAMAADTKVEIEQLKTEAAGERQRAERYREQAERSRATIQKAREILSAVDCDGEDLVAQAIAAAGDIKRSMVAPLTEEEAHAWGVRVIGDGSAGIRALAAFVGDALMALQRGDIHTDVRFQMPGFDMPGMIISPETDYAARRAAGEGGHGMCEPILTAEEQDAVIAAIPLQIGMTHHAEMAVTTGTEAWFPNVGDRVRLVRKIPCTAPVGSEGVITMRWEATQRLPAQYRVDCPGYPAFVTDTSNLEPVWPKDMTEGEKP